MYWSPKNLQNQLQCNWRLEPPWLYTLGAVVVVVLWRGVRSFKSTVKLLPVDIQYLAHISTSASFTLLWQTHSWACFTMRLVWGWRLRNSIRYLAAYGISMLASLPHSFLILEKIELFLSESWGPLHPKELSSQGFIHRVHWRVDYLSSLQILESLDCSEYPCS